MGLGLRAKTRPRPRLRRTVVRVTASGNAGGGSKRKGKKQGGAFSTVEAAVSFLAQLLSAGDMFGTTGSSFKDDARFDRTDDGADKKVELRGWKWIKISGKARTATRETSTRSVEPRGERLISSSATPMDASATEQASTTP